MESHQQSLPASAHVGAPGAADLERLATNAEATGLYKRGYEHDACGIGAIAQLKGVRSHQTLDDALSVLVNLEH